MTFSSFILLPSNIGANHNSEQYPNGISAHRPSTDNNGQTDLRPAHVFHHDMPTYPPPGSAASHMPPPLHHDGTSVATTTRKSNTSNSNSTINTALFGDLPEGKRRKFILVEDLQRGCRVRVKVMLDQVDMNEIPDSYRKGNSVFPRSYFPVQMVDVGEVDGGGGRRGRGRFLVNAGDEDDGEGDGECTVGRTMVSVPGVNGGEDVGEEEVDVAVPGIGRGKKDREMVLNDLGYRMSWSQSRVFAGRPLFLQRAR